MTKWLIIVMILWAGVAQAQTAETDTMPPYKKTNKLPEFAILRPDSSWFTNKQLPEKKPVLFVYFSPTCGHCQLAAQAFVKDMDKLEGVQQVWVSYHTPQEIGEFAKSYQLSRFPNIVLGRDPNYKIPVFFRVQYTPFMAVYDKNGKFLDAYQQGASPETIAQLIANGK